SLIALRTHCLDAGDLVLLDTCVDAKDRYRLSLVRSKFIHADHYRVLRLDGPLIFISRVLDLLLDIAHLDRSEHPAHRIDLVDILASEILEPRSQLLDSVAPCKRISGVGNARFVSDDLLG